MFALTLCSVRMRFHHALCDFHVFEWNSIWPERHLLCLYPEVLSEGSGPT